MFHRLVFPMVDTSNAGSKHTYVKRATLRPMLIRPTKKREPSPSDWRDSDDERSQSSVIEDIPDECWSDDEQSSWSDER